MPNRHNKFFNCKVCPKPSYPKSKNPMLFSGNTNNPGSLLSPGMVCSRNINSVVIWRHGWTPNIINSEINHFGRRVGAPGGYGSPPRNLF